MPRASQPMGQDDRETRFGVMSLQPGRPQQGPAMQQPMVQYTSPVQTQAQPAPAARQFSLMSAPQQAPQRQAQTAPQIKYTAEMFGPVAGAGAIADVLNARQTLGLPITAAPAEPTAPAAPRVPESPYGPDYVRALEGEVIQTTGQEFERARQQILGNLASRGISADSPLAISLIAQAQSQEAEGRRRGLMEARTQAAERAAEFGMRQALLPSQIALGEAQARQQKIEADVAERTVGAREQRIAEESQRAAAETRLAKAEAELKNFTPEQMQRFRDLVIQKAVADGQIAQGEAKAQAILLEKQSSQWPDWVKSTLRNVFRVGGAGLGGVGGATLGGTAGSVVPFAGTAAGIGVGGASGAASGAVVGDQLSNLILGLFGQS